MGRGGAAREGSRPLFQRRRGGGGGGGGGVARGSTGLTQARKETKRREKREREKKERGAGGKLVDLATVGCSARCDAEGADGAGGEGAYAAALARCTSWTSTAVAPRDSPRQNEAAPADWSRLYLGARCALPKAPRLN